MKTEVHSLVNCIKKAFQLLRTVWGMEETIKISLRCDIMVEWEREEEILQLVL